MSKILKFSSGTTHGELSGFAKTKAPAPVSIYEEKNLFIMNGGSFSFVSQKTGLINESTYLLKDSWLEHVKNVSGCTHLKGNFIVAGNAARSNYYHWVFQIFASILTALKNAPSVDNLKILGPRLNRWRSEYLSLLPTKLDYVEIPSSDLVIVENALFSNVLWGSYSFNPNPEVLALFDDLEVPKSLTKEKFYISRSDTPHRNVVNEDQVISMLEKYGYEKVLLSELSVAEQISLFRHAKEIVAPHGAGLVNLVYSSKNTKVIELFQDNYLNSCFWAIADCKGMDYLGLVNPTAVKGGGYHQDSMVVDVAELEIAVSQPTPL